MTEWVPNWKRNGWMTSKKEPVKNREDIQRLDSLCQQVNVKWVSFYGKRNYAIYY